MNPDHDIIDEFVANNHPLDAKQCADLFLSTNGNHYPGSLARGAMADKEQMRRILYTLKRTEPISPGLAIAFEMAEGLFAGDAELLAFYIENSPRAQSGGMVVFPPCAAWLLPE